MGHSLSPFFFIFRLSILLTLNNVQYKFCLCLDSNRRPLVSEATALPTKPQPLPKGGRPIFKNLCGTFSMSLLSILGHEGCGTVLLSRRRDVYCGDVVTFGVCRSCGECVNCAQNNLAQKCENLFKVNDC